MGGGQALPLLACLVLRFVARLQNRAAEYPQTFSVVMLAVCSPHCRACSCLVLIRGNFEYRVHLSERDRAQYSKIRSGCVV